MKRLEDAGCAAIVLHSLFEEQITAAHDGPIRHMDPFDRTFAEALADLPGRDDYALGPDADADAYAEHLSRTAVMSETVPAPTGGTANDDAFHDPLLIGMGLMFVVYAVVVLALAGLFSWGTMYDAPSWNAHSVPPPIVH